jgi:ribosome-binding protein aMBF1 (putative translation factor)
MTKDFLDEFVRDRSKTNSAFPQLVDGAVEARRLLRTLALKREKLGLSQTLIAARMKTSQSAVARLEAGEIDPRISTVERYAGALGQRLEARGISRRAASKAS